MLSEWDSESGQGQEKKEMEKEEHRGMNEGNKLDLVEMGFPLYGPTFVIGIEGEWVDNRSVVSVGRTTSSD